MKTFTLTSNNPYIRHDYKIILSNQQSFIVDNYEDCLSLWFQIPEELKSHVEVLDKKKGFK